MDHAILPQADPENILLQSVSPVHPQNNPEHVKFVVPTEPPSLWPRKSAGEPTVKLRLLVSTFESRSRLANVVSPLAMWTLIRL